MKRRISIESRRRSGDRIALAGRSAGRAARRTAAAVLLLAIAGPGAALADCPPGDGAGAVPCPAASPPAAAAAPSPDTAQQGAQELVLAKQSIDEGERASDDAGRRKAYETAKQHADRAVALMPQSADAHFLKFAAEGRIAQLGGIAVAALQLVKLNNQLDEVLRLDPNHANALAARGGMLMKLPRLFGGNTSKGVQYLERAVALDDTAVGKRLELAEAYHIVGRDAEAKTTAQSALDTARKLNEPDRIATCERFIVELDKTCDGCAVAAIGR